MMQPLRNFSAALVLLGIAGAVLSQPTTRPRQPEDAVTPAVKHPGRHDELLKRAAQGNIDLLFLGDSITDFFPGTGRASWQKLAPYKPASFGVTGDRTEHVLWRITNGELDKIAPKVVVILIGTNNLGHIPDEQPQWVVTGIETIVTTVREKLPSSSILLLAVFPRDARDSPMRARVAATNKLLSEMPLPPGVTFLDIGERFLTPDGELRKELFIDRLHLTPAGYELWYESMRPTLMKLMKTE